MGIMLCSKANPACALRVEDLGLRVYTVEELCYCILKHPLLFLDDFADEPLFRFLKEGAGEPGLATELRALKEGGLESPELLARLLEASGYSGRQEAERFRSAARALKALSEAEYWGKKGDYLFSLRKFGKAILIYDRVLSGGESGGLTTALRGRLLYSKGCACANLFLSEKAYRCFEEAYSLLKDTEILKHIYFLALTEPVIGIKERYLAAVEGKTRLRWDSEYEEARRKAADGTGNREITEVFSGDPVQRFRKAEETVRRWKEEYRTML
ncbi:MAG: hypothetical protein ACTTK0_01015 [Stomatobaculum sp.]